MAVESLDRPRVALLGVGLMGERMGRRLLAAGHPLAAWNRTRAKADALAPDGARVADDPSDAVRGADIVITMLSDGAAVDSVVVEAAPAMTRDAILVDMSSTAPAEARERAARLAAMGLHHLDAPVSGGTRGAEAGTLAIMVGGEEEAFSRARATLAVLGRPVRVGPAGSGQLAKLANQAIVAVTIGAVAEAVLLARAGGADPDALRDALAGGFADSVVLQQHGARMTARDFEPGGPSALQLKDLRNASAEAASLGITLPLTEQMRERYGTLVDEMGAGRTDHAAILLELERRNGMEAPSGPGRG